MFWQNFFCAWRDDLHVWVKGRNAYIRVPLLIYLAYAGFHYVGDTLYSSWFGGLIFGIHELGHVIFRALGEFMSIAGGSLTQIAVPIIGLGILLYQRDYFGIAVAGCWLSFSLYHLATYIGDAQVMQLPLFNIGGGDTYHDWEYLLVQVNLLEYDSKIAALTRGIALLVLLLSLGFGAWVCWLMWRNREEI